MTKRKAKVDPFIEGIKKSGARAAAAYRKAIGDSKSGRLVYAPERFTRADVERVIEACAEAAQNQLPFVAVNARRHMHRAVTAAGRRAAKEHP